MENELLKSLLIDELDRVDTIEDRKKREELFDEIKRMYESKEGIFADNVLIFPGRKRK